MLKSLLADMERKLSRSADDFLVTRSKELLSDLEAATPVDTGYARASWRQSNPIEGRLEISNTAEYIESLNAGHSAQAPTHFVEKVALGYGVPNGTIVTTLT